jgi:uncharacterized protein
MTIMSDPPVPPRLLVVAYRTLGGLQLLDEVADRVTQGRCGVHVLVPVADDDGSARQRAAEALQVQLERLAAIGAEVTGEVVGAGLTEAVREALAGHAYDELVVCTLPRGLSRWLRHDLVEQLRAVVDVPVHQVTAPAGLPERITGTAVRLTVFIGENDRYDGRPLGNEIVQRARAAGLAGATVLRGLSGFGASQVLHTARRVTMSDDLPIVIVVVDVAERIEAFLPVLDELVTEGLVVTETVDVVKYAGRRSD